MPRKAEGRMRLDTSVTDRPTVERAQRLMDELEAGNADLYRGALDVFDWCVREVREGRTIASFDRTGEAARARELSTPLLDAARRDHRQARMTLHAEAFDRVAHLVDAPPEPTQALRELMSEAYRTR